MTGASRHCCHHTVRNFAPQQPWCRNQRQLVRCWAKLASLEEPASKTGQQICHFMRHGQTVMNVFLSQTPYGSQDFIDPLIYDAPLTDAGVLQAKAARKQVAGLNPQPELVVSSPLARALHTADLAFPASNVPRIMLPIARERLYLSSDVGQPRSALAELYPGWDTSLMKYEIWWYNDGSGDPKKVLLEPEVVFRARLMALRRWLWARPERCIALVAHAGVISHLTGAPVRNAELRTVCTRDLAVHDMGWSN